MPKPAWVAFDLHVSIVIPCLLEQVVTYFNEVYSLKENETVFWREKIWFFLRRYINWSLCDHCHFIFLFNYFYGYFIQPNGDSFSYDLFIILHLDTRITVTVESSIVSYLRRRTMNIIKHSTMNVHSKFCIFPYFLYCIFHFLCSPLCACKMYLYSFPFKLTFCSGMKELNVDTSVT